MLNTVDIVDVNFPFVLCLFFLIQVLVLPKRVKLKIDVQKEEKRTRKKNRIFFIASTNTKRIFPQTSNKTAANPFSPKKKRKKERESRLNRNIQETATFSNRQMGENHAVVFYAISSQTFEISRYKLHASPVSSILGCTLIPMLQFPREWTLKGRETECTMKPRMTYLLKF